ncbi:MAG: hypothetical protein ACFFCW_42430, partial [Candidatus Hodarchaeota archaeon]
MKDQLKSNLWAFSLVIFLTVTCSIQVAECSIRNSNSYINTRTLTPINPNRVPSANSVPSLAKAASLVIENDDEPELHMTQLAIHITNQLDQEKWGFRPTPQSSDPTLIATAYGVIVLRYFGFENRYPDEAEKQIINSTYNLSKKRADQYLFVDQLDGQESIEATWAGITTLYTLNNLSLVDFVGVANYLEQFRDPSGGYNEANLQPSIESTYWAIEIFRIIDPLTPAELLTPSMKNEIREFILNTLDTTKYRFDDPSQADADENYQLSTFYALMTLRALGEHQVMKDSTVNIARWIASTQYFNNESMLNGGFADRSSSSNETVLIIPTTAALASLNVLNETVSEDLFKTMINTTLANSFTIKCNLAGGGFSDRPGGSVDDYSLENIFFGLLGLLSSGKFEEKLDPSPQFEPMPIVRGDNVTITYSPEIYGEGPHEGFELEVTVDGRSFGVLNYIKDEYQLNLTHSDYPSGMFLGNHSLVAQMRILNSSLLPTASFRKTNFMTVGLSLRYGVDAKEYAPGDFISFTGTLTDRYSENLSENINTTLIDPLGKEIANTMVQASNGSLTGSIKVPNAPLLGNHTLTLKISYHTTNTTRVYIFDQPVLTFITSNSFEGNTSRTYHVGDNITLLAQVRYNSTRSIPEAFVRTLNGSVIFQYTNKTLFSGIFNETEDLGYYNISGTIPRQLLTGDFNVTAEIEWPNIDATITAPIGLKIVTDFEITEREGFPSPFILIQYGQRINWTFKVHEAFSNRTIETITLASGLINMTSTELEQEFSYSQANDTYAFTIDDFPDPNLLQGSYYAVIRGMLVTNETYIDLLDPIRITIDGQFDIQQIIFLNGRSVEPGKKFLADFLIVNPEFNNAIISDLIFVSTISGPGGEYVIDLTNLGFYSDGYQLLWQIPEDVSEGAYSATISRNADMLVVGTFEFRVASVIPI